MLQWVSDPKDKTGVPKGAGMTALHYAAMYDRVAIVKLLLAHGVRRRRACVMNLDRPDTP